MKLEELLAEDKTSVLEAWLARVLATYPADAARFFEREKNRFANPVGQTLAAESAAVLDGLIAGKSPRELEEPVARLMKLRSIQDFAPSQAVACLTLLKPTVRAWVAQEPSRASTEELRELEERIDALVFLGFDLYVQCRERLYELRVNEVKRNVSTLLRRLEALEGRGRRAPAPVGGPFTMDNPVGGDS